MADIVTFDPDTLRITEIAVVGNNELNVQEVYSEWKQWCLDDPTRLAYPAAFRYVGADPISETQNLGTTYFLTNGWRIRPAEANHRLKLNGNLYTDPAGESPVVGTLGSFAVVVEYSVSNLVDSVLVNSPDIQFASFEGAVTVDAENGTAGTEFPAGTKRQPVDNLADALVIRAARGLNQFDIIGNIILHGGDFSDITFVGESQTKTTIDIEPAAVVTGCHFQNANVTGELDGGGLLLNCAIKNLSYVDGFIKSCALTPGGLIALSGVAVAKFLDCASGLGVGTAADTLAPEPDTMSLTSWWRGDVATDFSWTDQVGANNLLQATPSLRGELRVDGPNERRFLRFDHAEGQYMATAGLPQSSLAYTLFAVVRTAAASGEPTTFNTTLLEDGYGFQSAARGALLGGAGGAGASLSGSTLSDEWELWILSSNGTSYTRLSVNGEEEFTSDEVAIAPTGSLFIGGPFAGRDLDVAEVGIAARAFTLFEEAQLLTYVTEYYNILVADVPTIDMGGSGSSLAVRNYNGDLLIKNKTGAEAINIDLNSGHIVLDETVVAGNIKIRGTGKLTDNSVGAVVDSVDLVNPLNIAATTDTVLTASHGAGDWSEVTLADGAITAAKIAAGAIGAVQAPLLANLDATVSSAGLSETQATMLLEMYRLLGLDPTKPLVVTATTRKVPEDGSDVSQTIVEESGTVTVTRQ